MDAHQLSRATRQPFMTPLRHKTVAIVDPLWVGHHPMYFCQFAASFLRAGVHVMGLCPDPLAAFRDLQNALGSELASDLGERTFFHTLPAGKAHFFQGRYESDPVRTILRWRTASDTLAAAEAESGMHADLVYFPYLDSYLRFLPFAAIPEILLNRPWSGLYLRNHHHGGSPSVKKSLLLRAKGDAILRSPLCRGVGVLDERFIPAMENYSGNTIIRYPDVTQSDLPATPYLPAMEIQRKAAGRKIIGIIGLERRKGLLTLLRTAALARQAGLPYYFVCAGTILLAQFTATEQAEIQAVRDGIASGEIQNIHFDRSTGRIAEEADYNFLFRTFDVVWAAYEGFEGSSGTLSKAAAFELPCLATAGECVGSRVESYRLGLTIPSGSAADALTAITHLLAHSDAAGQPLAPRFAAYREDHSSTRLDRILAELINSLT